MPISRATLLASVLTIGAASASDFALGADISWLPEMESNGRAFQDSAGVVRPLLDILSQDYCLSTVRIRVWVNPANQWSSKADAVALAMRAKAKGYRVMLDFHYSSSWADPGVQTPPAAWAGLALSGMKQAVYDHTYDVVKAMVDSGASPEWVQVGNETNNGMLWELGKATSSMSNFAQLVSSGSAAVKSASPSTKVIIHLSNAYDNVMYRWIFDGMKNNSVPYDVIGMSFYPAYLTTSWQVQLSQVSGNLRDMVSRYGKDVMIVETGMPVRDPATAYNMLSALIDTVQAVPNERGLGVLYWEPEAHVWKVDTMSAWGSNSRPTRAMNAFRDACVDPVVGSKTIGGIGERGRIRDEGKVAPRKRKLNGAVAPLSQTLRP